MAFSGSQTTALHLYGGPGQPFSFTAKAAQVSPGPGCWAAGGFYNPGFQAGESYIPGFKQADMDKPGFQSGSKVC